MQTFLPRPSFAETARDLDGKRLGKQRVETLQIMGALLTGTGWVNHPATRMWRGHEQALYTYQLAICREWTHWRGYRDTCLQKTEDLMIAAGRVPVPTSVMPSWLCDTDFHLSHQSNLVRKFPEHYGPLYPGVADDLPYIWPEP